MRHFVPLLFLTACGIPAPRPGDPLARYPAQRYIVAEGEGEGRGAAEAAARARVAEQISARIEATFEVETRSNGEHENQRIHEQIRSRSAFAHAELIEVPPALVRCAEARCQAVGVLDRARADEVLAAAYAEPAARFGRAVEAASRADSIVGFTRHLRSAEEAWPALAPLGYQRQVILGATPRAVEADRRTLAGLLVARDRRMAALRLTVVLGDLPEGPLAEPTRAALTTALTQLGLAARTADACTEGIAVVPRGQVACSEGSFGPRCTLNLTAELQPCPSGAPLAALDLRGAKLVGASPQGELDARRRLAERITAERLAPVLAEPLRALVPLP